MYDRLEEDTQTLAEKAFNEAINLTSHLLERLAAATKGRQRVGKRYLCE